MARKNLITPSFTLNSRDSNNHKVWEDLSLVKHRYNSLFDIFSDYQDFLQSFWVFLFWHRALGKEQELHCKFQQIIHDSLLLFNEHTFYVDNSNLFARQKSFLQSFPWGYKDHSDVLAVKLQRFLDAYLILSMYRFFTETQLPFGLKHNNILLASQSFSKDRDYYLILNRLKSLSYIPDQHSVSGSFPTYYDINFLLLNYAKSFFFKSDDFKIGARDKRQYVSLSRGKPTFHYSYDQYKWSEHSRRFITFKFSHRKYRQQNTSLETCTWQPNVQNISLEQSYTLRNCTQVIAQHFLGFYKAKDYSLCTPLALTHSFAALQSSFTFNLIPLLLNYLSFQDHESTFYLQLYLILLEKFPYHDIHIGKRFTRYTHARPHIAVSAPVNINDTIPDYNPIHLIYVSDTRSDYTLSNDSDYRLPYKRKIGKKLVSFSLRRHLSYRHTDTVTECEDLCRHLFNVTSSIYCKVPENLIKASRQQDKSLYFNAAFYLRDYMKRRDKLPSYLDSLPTSRFITDKEPAYKYLTYYQMLVDNNPYKYFLPQFLHNNVYDIFFLSAQYPERFTNLSYSKCLHEFYLQSPKSNIQHTSHYVSMIANSSKNLNYWLRKLKQPFNLYFYKNMINQEWKDSEQGKRKA